MFVVRIYLCVYILTVACSVHIVYKHNINIFRLCVATATDSALCLWIQWKISAYSSWSCLLSSIRNLHWELPEGSHWSKVSLVFIFLAGFEEMLFIFQKEDKQVNNYRSHLFIIDHVSIQIGRKDLLTLGLHEDAWKRVQEPTVSTRLNYRCPQSNSLPPEHQVCILFVFLK